jgi:hypothetical protein
MKPLMGQFHFTPWAEIPEGARDQIKVIQLELRQQALAEEAISLGVPVSEMSLSCHPKFPHCLDLSHPDNRGQVGRLYSMVLLEALEAFARASADSGEGLEWVMTHLNPQLSYLDSSALIQKAIVDEHRKWQVSLGKLKEFNALLPKSAVLPTMKWPETQPHPVSCRGVSILVGGE